MKKFKDNYEIAMYVKNHLENCAEDECILCGVIYCPHHEPLHMHHDGCPQCDGEKQKPCVGNDAAIAVG